MLLLSFSTLLLAVLLNVFYLQWFGFPDGHLTELERARVILYNIFTLLSIMLSLWYGYMGLKTTQSIAQRKLLTAIFIYIALLFFTGMSDYYLELHLDHGIGG